MCVLQNFKSSDNFFSMTLQQICLNFFHDFVRLEINGGFHFLSPNRKVWMTLSFSLTKFCRPNIAFRILFFSRVGLWRTEGSCSDENIAKVANNAKRASTLKYLCGLTNLCSSAVYNQGWFIIRAAYKWINAVNMQRDLALKPVQQLRWQMGFKETPFCVSGCWNGLFHKSCRRISSIVVWGGGTWRLQRPQLLWFHSKINSNMKKV